MLSVLHTPLKVRPRTRPQGGGFGSWTLGRVRRLANDRGAPTPSCSRSYPVLRAALAHLWFVTVHPFDDGNGRIARAIADWALARSEDSPQRFYSMSAQIRLERSDYYRILERTQKATLDVTVWMDWFLGCLGRAFDATDVTLAAVLRKARWWEQTGHGNEDGRHSSITRLARSRCLAASGSSGSSQ